MMDWLQQVSESGLDVLDSQAALVDHKVRRFALLLVAVLAIAGVAVAAACAFLASIVWGLAPFIGADVALLIVSVIVLASTLSALIVAHGRLARSLARSERRATQAIKRFNASITPDENKSTPTESEPKKDLIHDAIATIAAHPKTVSGAVFAVTSVLGIRRTVALIRTASTLASAGAIATNLAESGSDFNGKEQSIPPGSHVSTQRNRPDNSDVKHASN